MASPFYSNDIMSGTDINIFKASLKKNINSARTTGAFNKNNHLKLSTFKDKEKESKNEEMKCLLKTMYDIKKTNKNVTDEILNEKEENSKLVKLISQLERELIYYEELSMLIQGDLYLTTRRKETITTSESQAKAYCKEIKKKFKSVVEIIDKFEENIDKLQKEKSDMAVFYEGKIKDLAEEKIELYHDSEEIQNKIIYQRKVIEEIKLKIERLHGEKINQRELYEKKYQEDQDKYNELSEKYCALTEKLKFYISEEASAEYDQIRNKKIFNEMDNEKEEYLLKLTDKKVLNDNLKEEASVLNKNIAVVLKKIEALKILEKSKKNKYGL